MTKRTGGSGGSSNVPKPKSHYYQFTMKDVKRAFEKAQEEMIVANLISRTQAPYPYTSH